MKLDKYLGIKGTAKAFIGDIEYNVAPCDGGLCLQSVVKTYVIENIVQLLALNPRFVDEDIQSKLIG